MNRKSEEEQLEAIHNHSTNLSKLIGTIPEESPALKKVRAHQGWWRAIVMGLPEGQYLDKRNDVWKGVCNRLDERNTEKGINFLTQAARLAAESTLAERAESGRGMIEETRLNYNLLSSQPLCFNFFGELMLNPILGLQILQTWWPEVTELKKVIFEYAPSERYTNDNSAFDVAFEVLIDDQVGLIGLECKYTDTFSSTPYRKDEYENIYKASGSFSGTYEEFTSSNYNQLFRNQLIAEALVQNNKYDFVKTGLFCFQEDTAAIKTAGEFRAMLKDADVFKTITYSEFIAGTQRLDLDWPQREWTMLLWARYCGFKLSEAAFQNS